MSGIGIPPPIYLRGTSFPTSPYPGLLFWKMPENEPYYWDGSAWQNFAPGAPGAHGFTHVFDGSDPIPNLESLETEYNCDLTISEKDIVYLDSTDHVSLASADDVNRMPAIGIVTQKPTLTTALVITRGWYTGLLGLSAGPVWVGLNGQLTSTLPENQPGFLVSQKFGTVKDSNTLQVAPEMEVYL